LLAQRGEAVEVIAPGLQSGGLGMHAVGVGGACRLAAAGDDARKALVLGQLPAHGSSSGSR